MSVATLSIGRGISSQAKNGILRKLQQRQHNQLQFITGVVLKKRDSSDYKIGMQLLLVFTLFQGYASLCATYHPTVGLRHVKTAEKAITYLSFVLKFRITLLFASLLLEEFLDQSYCFPRKNIPELRLEFVIENKASYFFKNVQVTFV